MTRINVAIKPKFLTDQHLIAEHHEIIRIPGLFKNRLEFKRFNDLPTKFTLGNGHVLFFMTKGKYTLKRYKELYNECLNRGIKATDYSKVWDVYNNTPYFNDYVPTLENRHTIIHRIADNLLKSKQAPLYYSKPISKDEAIHLLWKV